MNKKSVFTLSAVFLLFSILLVSGFIFIENGESIKFQLFTGIIYCFFLYIYILILNLNKSTRLYSARLQEEVTKLKLSQKEAVKSNIAKSQFLADMSHEIRTPMNAILGFVQLLKEDPNDENREEYFDTIYASGTALVAIINDILDFSKIELDEIKFEDIDFDLYYLVEKLIELNIPLYQKKFLDLSYRIHKNVPKHYKGDPTRLRQVIQNILSNASKFTKKGGVFLHISKAESKQTDFCNLRFSISDSGIGISPKQRDKIFNKYSQADVSTTRKYGGTGLGLSICKKLVEKMNGTINVESVVGKGSKFIFTVELKLSDISHFAEIKPVSTHVLNGKNIIIVDKTSEIKKSINSICNQFGINTIEKKSFQDTIDYIGCIKTDNTRIPEIAVVNIDILDVPENMCVDILKSNQKTKRMKIIASCNNAYPGIVKKISDCGYDGFLAKPVDQIDFEKQVRYLLGDKKNRKKIFTRHLTEELSKKEINILVAEDNKVNQTLIRRILTKFGCQFKIANNGRCVIDFLKDRNYDIILMDVMMPEVNGIEATKIIRETISKDIPIIALTASAQTEDEKRCKDAGMNDFLSKPIDIEKLKEIIKIYIA